MSDLTPITREEALLDGQDLEPITRKEMFIKHIYDDTQEIPEPATREEWFLKKAGEGSSPVTIEALSVTENGTYSEAGKAYSPVTVEVPSATLKTKTITANGTYNASSDNADGYSSVTVNVPYMEKKSASGDIASFSDGAGYPFLSVKANINPVQDLHGYDYPWVGGAGKNKIPIDCGTQTKQGVTYTVYKNEDGAVTKIHAQGTATAAHSFSVVERYSSSDPFMIKAGSYWFKGISNGASVQFDFNIRKQGESSDLVQVTDKKPLELSEDTYFQSCYLYVYNGATINTDIYPMVWSQSSPNDDFEPYSNICPISGWTAANVTACGANLWDEEWEVGGITVNTDTVADGNKNNDTDKIRTKNYQPIKGGKNYYLVYPAGKAMALCLYDKNKNFIGFSRSNDRGGVATQTTSPNSVYSMPNEVAFVMFYMGAPYGTTYNNDISINYPSTDTEYHAYNGNTYSVSWQTEAGTVYSGTVDLVSGVLTVDRASVDLGALNWVTPTVGGRTTASLGGKPAESGTSIANAYCDIYNIITPMAWYNTSEIGIAILGAGYGGNGSVGISDTGFDGKSATEVANALDGHQLVYELATPQMYQLTPQQIATLVGQNNVFNDTNGQTEVSYYIPMA